MNIIDLLTKNYNESWHSTIKNFPYKIINSIGDDDILVKETKQNISQFADSLLVKDKLFLKKNDYVRISLLTFPEYQKDKFLKRYNKNYTKEIYRIHKVSRSPIKKYLLMNLKGEKYSKIYYYEELMKVIPDELLFANIGQTPVKTRKFKT